MADHVSASPCGPTLDRCRCRRVGPVVRTDAERRALHTAAVDRARQPRPTPTWLPVLAEDERHAAYVRIQHARRGAA